MHGTPPDVPRSRDRCNGFIGRAAAAALAQHYDVIGLDDHASKAIGSLLELVPVDMTNEGSIDAAIGHASTMLVHAPTEPGRPINEGSPIELKWDYPKSKWDVHAPGP